ncbi:MAG: histidine phosphatase family protein [Candidatus Thorarchaeota archaeon]
MTNNFFIFLRHGDVIVNLNLQASLWELSEGAKKAAEELAYSEKIKKIDLIYSSSENKAIQSALPFSRKYNCDIIVVNEFSELNRKEAINIFSTKEYQEQVKKAFQFPDESINNWESINHAISRFTRKIAELDENHSEKNILIVSHGIILIGYFCSLKNNFQNAYQNWIKLQFLDFGFVKENKIIKDITL